ncbi:hypothetical protein NPIL_24111, partial [Nephila pilipes]
MSSQLRHIGRKDKPESNRCLGVFGLSLYTREKNLTTIFGKYGAIEKVQLIYDAR